MIAFASAAKRAAAALAVTAAMAGCSVTQDVDRVAVGSVAAGQAALRPEQAGRALLVLDSGLRPDTPDRAARAEEAKAVVRQALAEAGLSVEEPGAEPAEGWAAVGEERLLKLARERGLRSLLLVRVEDYTNLLSIQVPLPLPTPLVRTDSQVGLRVKLVDAADGAVLVDAYRDRTQGGYFTVRTRADLAPALREVVRSMVAKAV